MKKVAGQESGGITTRLKHQLLSVNGDYSNKTVRDFIDSGALLSRDAIELRKHIDKVTPDIDTNITITFKDGTDLTISLPMTTEFFFPGSGL